MDWFDLTLAGLASFALLCGLSLYIDRVKQAAELRGFTTAQRIAFDFQLRVAEELRPAAEAGGPTSCAYLAHKTWQIAHRETDALLEINRAKLDGGL